MQFQDLKLNDNLLLALREEEYDVPTPVQAQAIPHILEGRDLLGCAQTGTGKTAAFALPMLHRLSASTPNPVKGAGHPIRALILTPTRELALQIDEGFAAYGRHLRLKHAVIFGGVSDVPQKDKLRRGVDILVATPGRLLDLLSQRSLTLGAVEILVLDEADRMLDMGFIHDIRRIVSVLPAKRQNLLFSATMPAEIRKLAGGILRDPVNIEVTPVSSTVDKISQSVYFVDKGGKSALLHHLLSDRTVSRALVFTRTKHGANKVSETLSRGQIQSEAFHGNKSQGARQRVLANFKAGSTRVLVATDIAARGIDIDEISHVVNFDIPNIPETYVHRIGRTARAGASGIAFSLCDREERSWLADIEKVIRKRIPVCSNPMGIELSQQRDQRDQPVSGSRPPMKPLSKPQVHHENRPSQDSRPSRPPSYGRRSEQAPRGRGRQYR